MANTASERAQSMSSRETDPRAPESPDQMKGPGGLTMRQIHEQVKKSAERDRQMQKVHNPLVQPQNRWQRFVRYVWGRSGRR
jgi:hypothetical protein